MYEYVRAVALLAGAQNLDCCMLAVSDLCEGRRGPRARIFVLFSRRDATTAGWSELHTGGLHYSTLLGRGDGVVAVRATVGHLEGRKRVSTVKTNLFCLLRTRC